MTRPKPRIGEVAVLFGDPPDGNPRSATSLLGPLRQKMLVAFRDGEPTDGYTFWCVPYTGHAYRLQSNEDINWMDMRS